MIGLEEIPYGQHICALYANDQERMELVQFFLKPALEHGDVCCIISDRLTSSRVLSEICHLGAEMNIDIKSRVHVLSFSRLACKADLEGAESAESEWIAYISDIAHSTSGNAKVVSLPGKAQLTEEQWRAYESFLDRIASRGTSTVCCMYKAVKTDLNGLWTRLSMHKRILSGGWVCRNPAYLEVQESRLSADEKYARMLDNAHLVALENEITCDNLDNVLITKNHLRGELAHRRIELEKMSSLSYHFLSPLSNIRSSTSALRSHVSFAGDSDAHLEAISAAVDEIEECLRETVECGAGRWTGADKPATSTISMLNANTVQIRRAA